MSEMRVIYYKEFRKNAVKLSYASPKSIKQAAIEAAFNPQSAVLAVDFPSPVN